ncbi:MAG TPA: lipid A deacylase LpxR family protein, partial [Alphaproteobacteria bacterium]
MSPLRQIPCLCAAALLLSHASAWAQNVTTPTKPPSDDPDKTVEQQVPPRITHTSQDNIISLDVENDLFGGGTDNNYTSGVRASYQDVNAHVPGFARKFADVMPGFEVNDTTSLTYSIGQNLYTPNDIENRAQDPNDRPWAGFLYGSMGMATTVDDHTDEVELTLGVVGPAALGEQTQKFIHRHLSNSPMPKGWSNQLKNEPAVMVGWQREYPR